MLKLLRYAFYRAYKLLLSLGRSHTEALITLLSIPIIANIYSLERSIYIIIRSAPPKLTLIGKIIVGIIYFILILLMNKYLTTKERKKEIFKEFENISKREKYKLNFLYFLYLVISFPLSIFIANIIRAKEYLYW